MMGTGQTPSTSLGLCLSPPRFGSALSSGVMGHQDTVLLEKEASSTSKATKALSSLKEQHSQRIWGPKWVLSFSPGSRVRTSHLAWHQDPIQGTTGPFLLIFLGFYISPKTCTPQIGKCSSNPSEKKVFLRIYLIE